VFGRLLIPGIAGFVLFVYMSSPDAKPSLAMISQTCSDQAPGVVTATFAWPAPASGARQVWLDLSPTAAFTAGWTHGYGPLPASQTVYAVDGVPSGLKLHYRVNALSEKGWRLAAAGTFDAACPRPG
jgi:hypothetical protein